MNRTEENTVEAFGYRCRVGKRSENLPTAKQAQVIAGLAAGMTQKEIARLRGVSPATIKSTTESVYFWLHATRATDAVAKALSRGWISPLCIMLVMFSLAAGAHQQANRIRPARQPVTRTASTARREVSA